MSSTHKKTAVIRLSVPRDFELPAWFATATPNEIGDFLLKAAKSNTENEHHSSQFHALLQEIKANSEATRLTLQSRIDELTAREQEASDNLASITSERDHALLSKCDETANAPFQEHAESITTHLTEMFEMYANHNSLLRQLDESITAIRVKAMAWYRNAKKTDLLSRFNLTLPWEHAYEHAIGRSWNNMTSAKAKELEKRLGRKAAEMVIFNEEVGAREEKRHRTV